MAGAAPEPTEATQAGQSPSTGTSGGSQLWNVLLPILGLIGTGIGVIGFVIFFGGFILWTRFDAAGLPANEAVAQVPRNDLIVTGASFLVPALLAALAAVAVAFVGWDLVVGSRLRGRVEQAEMESNAAGSEAEKLKRRARRIAADMAAAQTSMQAHAAAAESAPIGAERDAARQRLDQAESQLQDSQGELAQLEETEIPEAEQAESNTRLALAQARRPTRGDRFRQLPVGGLPMLVTELLLIAEGWGELNWGPRILLLGVMAATVAVAVVVFSITRSFAWYAAAVFVGVGSQIAFSTYERTHVETKVSPVAALQAGAPVTGFFVAETSDAVYVAHPVRKPTKAFALDHQLITLVRLPKDSLAGLTVGPLTKETTAYKRSIQLALALCRQPKPGGRTTKTSGNAAAAKTRHARHPRRPPTPEPTCSVTAIQTLQTQLPR